MTSTLKIVAWTLAAVLCLGSGSARAQSDYPNKVIHFVVGFAAGGGNDLFARLVVQKLQLNTGWNSIIENKPGAGGRLSSSYVAKIGRAHV